MVKSNTIERKEYVLSLCNNGLSQREISKIIGVSHQRVQQIINGNREPIYLKYRLDNCEFCWKDYTKVNNKTSILHVHHLDGNHKNNNKTNLMTLCSQCHAELHQAVKKPVDK